MAEASGTHRGHRTERLTNIKRDLEPFIKTQGWWKPRRPILRVGSRLKEPWREQFEPGHLFLGLYNRSSSDDNNPKTKGNIFRLSVVGAFLAESGKTLNDWESVCARIVEDPKAMLEKYNEEGLDDVSILEDVRSVLSLDAIFLACFLSTFFNVDGLDSWVKRWFPSLRYVIGREGFNFHGQLMVDILKLENQIPLVLIKNVLLLLCEIVDEKRRSQRLEPRDHNGYDGDAQSRSDEVLQVICAGVATFFHSGLPGSSPRSLDFNNPVNQILVVNDTCEHLLHCVYVRLISERSNAGSNETEARKGKVARSEKKKRGEEARYTALVLDTPMMLPQLMFQINSVLTSNHQVSDTLAENELQDLSYNPPGDASVVPLAPASELRKAGIVFRGHAGLDVKFEKHFLGATLFLPRIHYFGDVCEPMWRNLLAFEDGHELRKQFLSYLVLMDELIDMEEDVELLRRGKHPVFVNVGVGSNAEVARIFNSMTRGHFVYASKNLEIVRRQILDYYNNKNRQTWVEFRRTNFGKPWLFASFLAACTLLVLSFLQTLFTILTYKYTF